MDVCVCVCECVCVCVAGCVSLYEEGGVSFRQALEEEGHLGRTGETPATHGGVHMPHVTHTLRRGGLREAGGEF